MKAPLLTTQNARVRLVEPVVSRDAPLSMKWLEGKTGRRTLEMMGVAGKDNHPSTLETERQRVREFIEREDQLNWMVELDGMVVGSVWVDVTAIGSVPAPAVHIMIGGEAARGQGVGSAALRAVIAYLKQSGSRAVYSRTLVKNSSAARLLGNLGFRPDGTPYTDADGLEWQNLALHWK